MKSNLIIGVIKGYDWSKVSLWALSIITSGFKGTAAVIQYYDPDGIERDEEVAKNLKSLGIQVINMRLEGQIFSRRFYDIHSVLRSRLDSFDHVIATDVRDVMFQSDPAAWLSQNLKKGIYAATEGLRYRDEDWGRSNLAQSFGADGMRIMDELIYNAGVISGKAESISDLFYNIYVLSEIANMPSGGGGPDQAAYNMLLNMKAYQSEAQFGNHEDGYAAQLGTTADPSKIDRFRPFLVEPEPIMEDGVVKTSTGIPFCVVHQYDRHPEWDKIIRERVNNELRDLRARNS
jgi:hypothetical protein